MTADEDASDFDPGARRLKGSMLEHAGLPVERMPGLAAALEGFVAEAAKSLAPLVNRSSAVGVVEPARATTLFRALGDCAGLTAAIYASVEAQAQMLIALDERVDDLIVASVFGESVTQGEDGGCEGDESRLRTPIETALLEELARGLGRAMDAGFAPVARLSLSFERLEALRDVFALGRRDVPAVAARFSMPMVAGVCAGLALMPQSLLLPFRRELERERAIETPSSDRRWSNSMEAGLRQTSLPVTAVLEELSMSLGDVANFRIGDVLLLQTSHFDFVRLECAGRGMFLCKLGQGDGRYCLEVERPIAQPFEPSPL